MMNKTHNKSFIGIVGATCAAVSLALVTNFEGVSYYGYRDPVGIPTKCYGDTLNVTVGKHYTEAECKQSLETQMAAKASGVLACVPGLKDRPYQLAASISFAYNIGVSAFCQSTTAKRFNSGNYAGACKAMQENDNGRLQWITARGVVLKGLIRRREKERAVCEQGLEK